jgi:hypothetical protein
VVKFGNKVFFNITIDIQGLIRQVATLSPVGHISTWLFLMDNW